MASDSEHTNPYTAAAAISEAARVLSPAVPLNTRLISGTLAISGAIYALLAWIIPFFWPGYFVWGGWIAIAFGVRRINKPWFWFLSTTWNLGMAALLLSSTEWSLQNKALVYWLCRIHSVMACGLSLMLAISLLQSRDQTHAQSGT